MPSKPMQRSLKHLKDNGWTVAVVEKWIPPRGTMKFGVRQDVWGFGDILASKPACRKEQGFAEPGNTCLQTPGTCESCPRYWDKTGPSKPMIALVQTTDQTSIPKHRAKILAIPEFEKWKAAGGLVFLHGWKKRPKDGVRGAKKTWQLKEEVL